MEEEELVKEIEEACSKEEAKSFKKISKMVNPKIESYFVRLGEYIDIVRNSDKLNSLLFVSPPGLGKTTHLLYFLMKAGLKPIQDFVFINTHTTPLSLYTKLYENKDKIIIFDDVIKIFKDDISKAIFLSALWSPTQKRVVNWNSIITMESLGMPKKFVFNGKVFVLLNSIPKEIAGIESRCLIYNMRFSRQELLGLMDEIANLRKMPPVLMNFIKLKTDASCNLSLRTLVKVNEFYKINPSNWEELSAEQLEIDKEIAIIIKLMKEKMPVKEQIKKFIEESGYSRRTFFLKKAELRIRERG